MSYILVKNRNNSIVREWKMNSEKAREIVEAITFEEVSFEKEKNDVLYVSVEKYVGKGTVSEIHKTVVLKSYNISYVDAIIEWIDSKAV